MEIIIKGLKSVIFEFREFIKKQNRESLGDILNFVLIALISFLMIRFGFQRAFFMYWADSPFFKDLPYNDLRLVSQIYLSASSILLFVITPLLFHLSFPTREKNPFGLKITALREHLGIYFLLFLFMLPLIWISCGGRAFQNFYPMFKPGSLQMWIIHELIYMVQFFCVEFFFRGIMLFRLEKKFQLNAVWIMLVPYMLLHLYKPVAEALGSVVAAVILGSLALKSRSIWPGVAVHCGVAFLTDFFSLLRSGKFWTLL